MASYFTLKSISNKQKMVLKKLRWYLILVILANKMNSAEKQSDRIKKQQMFTSILFILLNVIRGTTFITSYFENKWWMDGTRGTFFNYRPESVCLVSFTRSSHEKFSQWWRPGVTKMNVLNKNGQPSLETSLFFANNKCENVVVIFSCQKLDHR